MALTPSQRPTREWPLLVLALALVCAVCIPLWQWTAANDGGGSFWSRWTPERVGRLLLGPEQIACYCCFTWGAFIIGNRYRELRRQRRAFAWAYCRPTRGRASCRRTPAPCSASSMP